MDKHRKFDSLTCSLDNVNIIEASAGTGKTYNIQNLYARMILLKGFSVDSILVVTFTDAATKELKERIRTTLNKIHMFYEASEPNDEIKQLATQNFYIDKNGNSIEISLETRKKRLSLAIRDFDNAAIYTIHGFCNKMLNDYSFESGILFNVELEKDVEPIIRDIVEDFWRRESYTVDSFNTALLEYNKITINNLITFVNNFTNKGETEIEPKKTVQDNIPIIRKIFYQMKKNWDKAIIRKLLDNEYLSKRNFKPVQIDKICFNAELFLQGIFNKTTFAEVEKLSQENIDKAFTAAGKKAGKIPPQHNFFRDCSDLLSNKKMFESFGTIIRHKCRNYFDSEYNKRKNELNIQSFNDLLTRVNDHINSKNSPLLTKIQSQFNAALIDEFQDTDSIQYSIFKKVFIDSRKPLFIVGDPKQAIYGFRGGDIYTYRKAKEYISSIGEIFTLGKNWRSSPDMVNATNLFYKKNKDSYIPFVTEAIEYINVDSDEKNDNFRINSQTDKQPLKFIYIPGIYNTPELRQACCIRTATEIYTLLTNSQCTITENKKKRSIQPKDIAILVTSHHQAQLLQPELHKFNIPAVLQATGSLFDSTEAEHFEILLKAIAEPTNSKTLKGAMLTDIMGYSIDEITLISESNNELDKIYGIFKLCHEKWLNNSFIEMFNLIMSEFDIKSTLLAQIDGERKLTNVLHLTEIINQQEIDSKLGINGIIHWLSKQRNKETRNDKEEYEIRLETDDDAVKIMTVFRAKGLEFPIVFCPFLWDRNAIPYQEKSTVFKYHKTPDSNKKDVPTFARNVRAETALLHNIEAAPRLFPETSRSREKNSLSPKYKCILDISGSEQARDLSYDETLEELTRLMYVALTRSKYQCYILWGHTGSGSKKNSSALDYQFYSRDETISREKGTIAQSLSAAAQNAKDSLLHPLLTDNQANSIKLDISETILFDDSVKYQRNKLVAENDLSCRIFPAKTIDSTWMLTSFSSIAPHDTEQYKQNTAANKDHDENDNQPSKDIPLTTASTVNIFNFPAGAKTGTCWHEIFEKLDFTADDREIAETVIEVLSLYRLNDGINETVVREKEECVIEMVKEILNTSLSDDDNFKLSNIEKVDKLPEMEFVFSINKGLSTEELSNCLYDIAKGFGLNSKITGWNQHFISGFMTGFIDLIFRYNNKYYIVDWKSNKLNGTPEGFEQNGLKAEMGKHYYFLQYLIYTVALDKYLSMTMKNYDYDKHFGGVYYIFLRGVKSDVSSSPARGIFYDRPEKELIRKLGEVFS